MKEVFIELGKSILSKQHEYSCRKTLDDAEHIPEIKVIIQGIENYLIYNSYQKDEIEGIKYDLKQFSRNLYVDSCVANAEEDEDLEDVKAESIEYFDYIYEHEEHPY